jgi:hypothetical protein
MAEGTVEVREAMNSESPWTLGFHEAWHSRPLNAEFRHVRIEAADGESLSMAETGPMLLLADLTAACSCRSCSA